MIKIFQSSITLILVLGSAQNAVSMQRPAQIFARTAIQINRAQAPALQTRHIMTVSDAYKTLNIDPSAKISAADLKTTYRQLLFQHHPDVNPHLADKTIATATQKTRQIIEAYNLIEEEQKKEEQKKINATKIAQTATQKTETPQTDKQHQTQTKQSEEPLKNRSNHNQSYMAHTYINYFLPADSLVRQKYNNTTWKDFFGFKGIKETFNGLYAGDTWTWISYTMNPYALKEEVWAILYDQSDEIKQKEYDKVIAAANRIILLRKNRNK